MLKNHDWIITACIALLLCISLLTLSSTSLDIQGNIVWQGVLSKQIIFIVVGAALYFLISKSDFSYLKHPQVAGGIYILSIILLVVTLLFAPVINGAKRWLIIAGVQVQPSEIAKLALVIVIATIFGYRKRIGEWKVLALIGILLAPVLGLIYAQPNGSMTLMTLIISGLLIFTLLENQFRNILLVIIVSGLFFGSFLLFSGLWLMGLILLGVGIVTAVFSFNSRETWQKLVAATTGVAVLLGVVTGILWKPVLEDVWSKLFWEHQKERIEAFLNPEETEGGVGFNVSQAKIAIGSGQIWGKGWGHGTQSKLQFLPEHQSDFIFAAFAEEFGLMGSLVLMITFTVLILRIMYFSLQSTHDFFAMALLIGMGIKLLIEMFVNIGTNVGLIPATGVPLPFVSAGGTMMIVSFIELGIVQSIVAHNDSTYENSNL